MRLLEQSQLSWLLYNHVDIFVTHDIGDHGAPCRGEEKVDCPKILAFFFQWAYDSLCNIHFSLQEFSSLDIYVRAPHTHNKNLS